MKKIILASASPRRRELLGQLTEVFEVVPSGAEETITETNPYDMVCALARVKAEWVAEQYPDAVVIGADTMVYLEDEPLGKPHDIGEAREMLKKLSGRVHQVYTGVCVIADGKVMTDAACTDVHFAKLSDEEIERYLDTNESMDKAGAYGIQGYAARFIERIDGCYFNVVGLPLRLLYTMLNKI
ncbi:MAG: septum formation inhibitor Maf [Christensenellaceae bacterium]|nr:septum formation inhibitor Maf [Christensenellaceae bacterium]